MRRVDERRRVWLALAGLLLGCSRGTEPTRKTPTGVVGPGAGQPIPAETDGDDTDDAIPDAEPAGAEPGLPQGDCDPGSTAACYGGPPGTAGVGICHAGVAKCRPDGTWGDCDGWMAPMAEACNGTDDDCNGEPDDPDESCDTGMPGPCAAGAAGCDGGVMTCIPFVQPDADETCNDGVDNDCNGEVDDGCGTGAGAGEQPCNPMNPAAVCGPGQHCFATSSGQTQCQGPTGLGVQYDPCINDGDCVPDHICVDVGTTSYCMQWCTSPFDCPLIEDDCVPLEPPAFAGTQQYGVCWDGLP